LVYQFKEIGYHVYCAVEEVSGSRAQDANLWQLVFADILADFKALASTLGRHPAGNGPPCDGRGRCGTEPWVPR
jgi:hypothetical protein